MSQAMQAQVVPIRIDGLFEITGYRKLIPKKTGQVTITFGKPIKYEKNTDPETVATRLEDAVRNL